MRKTLVAHFADWIDKAENLIPIKEKGIFYPTKEQIISLHDFLINKFRSEGERNVFPGILHDGDLDFVCIRWYEDKSENKWEDIIYKGARIFNLFLEDGHPFVDGNKRTGFVTLWIFLKINNFDVKFGYLNYQIHYRKIKDWADAGKDTDNIKEIMRWIIKNETFYQKIKRCITNFWIKIRNLNF
ncbi:MAG: Fic family protein [Candidatus Thermoplasmatota archaeon]